MVEQTGSRPTVRVVAAADIATVILQAAPASDVRLASGWPDDEPAGDNVFVVADDAMDERDLDALCRHASGGREKLILVLRGSTHFSPLYLRRGFRGLLPLDRLRDEFGDCLAVLGYNGIYAHQADLSRIFHEYCRYHRINKVFLYEKEIAELMVVGRTIKSISDELSINYRSLLNYIDTLKKEQQIHGNKAGLISYFKRILSS